MLAPEVSPWPVVGGQEPSPKQDLPLEDLLDLERLKRRGQKTIQAPQKLLHDYEAFFIPAIILFLTGCALAAAFPNFLPARFSIAAPMILIATGIATASLANGRRHLVRLSLWMVALLAGCLLYPLAQRPLPANDIGHFAQTGKPAPATITATLTERRDNRRVVLSVTRIDGKTSSGKVLADLPLSQSGNLKARLQVGRDVRVTGLLSQPFHSPVPGTFNQKAHLKGQGITAILRRTGHWYTGNLSDQWPFPTQRVADAMKDQVVQTFQQALPSPQAEILGGLVLGDKAIPVDRNTKQAFIDTGLIHLLAASGMNVGIIAAAVYFALGRLRCPYRLQLGAAMAAVAFYSLLTGLPPSIQRAALMLEMALFLKLLNRELSGTFLLCVVTLLLVFMNPLNITNIGFQFSVLTTFGLLAMLPPLQNWFGYYLTRWIAGLLLIPAVAQLWVWPLSVAYFNRFPLHTIPFNIMALCLITPLTLLGFASALLGLVFAPAAHILAGVAKPVIDALLALVSWGDGMHWAQWSLPSPSPWQLMGLYGLLFLSLAGLSRFKAGRLPSLPTRRDFILVLIPACILVGSLAVGRQNTLAQQEFIALPLSDDRQPQQAYLYKPSGTLDWNLFVPNHLRRWESRTLSDYFRHRQIRRLRTVVLFPQTLDRPANISNHPASRRPGSQRNDLARAFADTRIDDLFQNDGSPLPRSFSTNKKVIHIHILNEPTAITLQTPNRERSAQILVTPGEQRTLAGKACLFSISQNPQAKPENGCAFSASPSTGFTRAVGDASRLRIYRIER